MLSQQNRSKLDNIVSQMVSENESDTNIQAIVNDFKSKYDKSNAPTTNIDQPGILGGVKALTQAPQELLGRDKLREYAEDPKGTGVKLLQAGQMAGQVALPWLSGVTTTPATEFGIRKLQDEPTKEAAIGAGTAGLSDLALMGAGTAITKGAKWAYPKLAKTLAGIPKEATDLAMKQESIGKSIFKGKIPDKEVYTELGKNVQKGYKQILQKNKKVYEGLGKKAQDAANYIESQAGKAISAEKEALRNMTTKHNFSDISRDIRDLVGAQQFGSQNVIPLKDIEKISDIANTIDTLSKKGMGAGELYAINKKIANMTKFDPRVVPEIGSEGSGVLKQAYGMIRERLGEISPSFSKASQKYAKTRTLRDNLASKLGDETAGSKLKNIIKKSTKNIDETVANMKDLQELDSMVPKKYKFMKKLDKTLSHQESITPRALLKGESGEVGGSLKGIIEKSLENPEIVRNEEALRNLDKALPKKYKFMSKIEKNVARQQFESFSPKSGLLHNIRLAGAVGLGGAGYATGKPELIAAGLGLGVAGAPVTYKGLLRGGSAIKRAMSKPAVQGASKQLATQILKLYDKEK